MFMGAKFRIVIRVTKKYTLIFDFVPLSGLQGR